MAKLQMQRVYLCALKKDKKDILETLQRLEMVEVRHFSQEYVANNADDEDVLSTKEQVRKNIDNAKDAMEILKTFAKNSISEPFFLNGRKEMSEEEYSNYFLTEYKNDAKLARDIVSSNKTIKEKKSEISQLNAKLESLKPWENLNVPLDFEGTKTTKLFIGTLPNNLSKIQIEEMIIDKLSGSQKKVEDIPFELEVVSSIDVLTYFTLICLKRDENSVYEALRMSGFIPPVVDGDKTVSEMKKDILEKIEHCQNEVSSLEKEIISRVDKVDNIRFLMDYESLRADSLDTFSKLHQLNKTFVLKGYIPKKYIDDLKHALTSKYMVDLQFEDVSQDDEDAPVLLQNSVLASPVEGVLESYSLPSAKDIDPTSAVAIFYYFMFGLMLSDAGYGLVIFIASVLGLVKFKDTLEEGWRKTLRMYALAGAFTIFWGVLFGSYFGDLFDVIAIKFFNMDLGGRHILAPTWFEPVKEPMRLLTFSLIVGIIHLFAGMFLKAVQYAKQKNYMGIISDVVLWYVLLVGCIALLIRTDMLGNIFGYNYESIPVVVGIVGKYLAIIGAIGIVVTNGDSKNIGARLGQGLYALYGISSYLSDVLSYSRLLALGLATGVIASVINMMAGMVVDASGKVVGGVLFAIIILGGHIFNLGINALGAYVHTNRLQYVEFFGKFYEGGGSKFNPLRMNTKYFKFKESRKNV